MLHNLKAHFITIYAFFKYLIVLFLHKLYIIIFGTWINHKMRGTGFRITFKRMLLHDMSKFSSAELCPYAQHFYGHMANAKHDPQFAAAWKHHYQNNDHHHEYHIDPKTGNYKLIPEDALMEMVDDWFAAEFAYNGKIPSGSWKWVEWYFPAVLKKVHPTSGLFLCGLLSVLGFEKSVMKGLTNDESKKFDWVDGLEKVKKETPELVDRFKVLWDHYKKLNS